MKVELFLIITGNNLTFNYMNSLSSSANDQNYAYFAAWYDVWEI